MTSTIAAPVAGADLLGSSMSSLSNHVKDPTGKLEDDSIKFHARDFLTLKQENLLADYELGAVLGEGGFGLVYSCVHRATGAQRAVKMLNKDPNRPQIDENIINEFNILKDLDHPNLVKVYDLYQDEDCFFIVTDLYMGGDVFDVLEEKGRLSEEDAALTMNNLLGCINYFHKRCLVHRDLKPENILLDAKQSYTDLKVIDFGLARYTKEYGDTLDGLVGSAYYVAPQVIEGNYTHKCDLWSAGVIAYALLSGFAPFDASTDGQVLDMVVRGQYDYEDAEWEGISELAKDFISQLLTYDEEDRPTAEQALQHPWLKRCRRSPRMNNALVRSNSRNSLRGLSTFQSKSNKLKQAACAMIASQLLTNEEKQVVDDAFRALDKSCNGTITKQDLNSSFNDLFGEDDESEDSYADMSHSDHSDHSDSDSDSEDGKGMDGSESSLKSTQDILVDNIFDHVNFSGTGAIQYSEFAVVMVLEKNMVTDDKLRAAFKMFDRDGKGFITHEDLATPLHMGKRGCNKIMQEFASDRKKEKISFDDFKKCILPEKKKEEEESESIGYDMSESSSHPAKTPLDESSRRHFPMRRSSLSGAVTPSATAAIDPKKAVVLPRLEKLVEAAGGSDRSLGSNRSLGSKRSLGSNRSVSLL